MLVKVVVIVEVIVDDVRVEVVVVVVEVVGEDRVLDLVDVEGYD